MDIEDDVIQLIPAPAPDMWVKCWDCAETDGVVYFQRICAFALVKDKRGDQRIITLCMTGDGTLYESTGHEIVYSATPPEEIILPVKAE